MNPELLSDCMDDQLFRAATLRQVVQLARKRRRLRMVRNGVTTLAVLLAALVLLPPDRRSLAPLAESDAQLVASRPAAIPPVQCVRTETGQFTKVTDSSGDLVRIESQPDLFRSIATRSTAPKVQMLSDQQLVAAFPQHPAIIAPGTEQARLVFYR